MPSLKREIRSACLRRRWTRERREKILNMNTWRNGCEERKSMLTDNRMNLKRTEEGSHSEILLHLGFVECHLRR
jgi:hypothetical protein